MLSNNLWFETNKIPQDGPTTQEITVLKKGQRPQSQGPAATGEVAVQEPDAVFNDPQGGRQGRWEDENGWRSLCLG